MGRFIEYAQKLGFTFCDDKKFDLFRTKVFNFLDGIATMSAFAAISQIDYYTYCNTTGTAIDKWLFEQEYRYNERFKACVEIIKQHSDSLKELLLYYVTFANLLHDQNNNDNKCNQAFLIDNLEALLNDSHIKYNLISDGDYSFVYPNGAKELDDALVIEPLEWLAEYPKSRNTYCRALKQYSDGEYTRDVADNFRKALEEFLQEYLGNDKNLESNRIEVGKELKAKGLDTKLSEMIGSLINYYKKINDEHTKHNDTLDERLLEFVMYQTGVFIRMLISVK